VPQRGRAAFAIMTLGLFPLNVVLFPATLLPLHIYEPRYRTLLADCIRTATPFGVVAVDQSALCTVGVVATVRDVTQQYADGRFDVIVEGRYRFAIRDVRDDVAAYLVANVSELADEAAAVDTSLRGQVAQLYNTVANLVFGAQAVHFNPEVAGNRLGSWAMAPKSGLDLSQKQELLEMRSENERLEYLLQHLSGILPSVRKADAVQRVIRNDGYFAS
jgi:ATP-dependent Lon protease